MIFFSGGFLLVLVFINAGVGMYRPIAIIGVPEMIIDYNARRTTMLELE